MSKPKEALDPKTLLLLLRAKRPEARARVLDELKRQHGHVTLTAEALGVGVRSLYRAADRDPEFGEKFRELAQGLDGSRQAAFEARGVVVRAKKPKTKRAKS